MKKSFWLTVLIVIICLLAGNVHSQQVNYRFRHLTVDNGLSHTDATCIIQDEKGFIWIGTYSGLDRYDGYNTKVYYNNIDGNQTAYLNRIADMHKDKNGNFWLATEGGLAMFDPTLLAFKKIVVSGDASANPLTQPLQKVLVSSQQLYTVSNNEISCYTINSDFSLTKKNIQLAANVQWPIFKIEADASGNVWIAHNSGLAVINPSGQSKNFQFGSTAANLLSALDISSDGNIYFSNQLGLYQVSDTQAKEWQKNKAANTVVDVNSLHKIIGYPSGFSYPVDMQKDNSGSFWLATSQGLQKLNTTSNGLANFQYNEFEKTSLTTNSVNSVFIDRSDCIWLTSFGGGVNIADLNQKSFGLIQRVPNSNNTISANYVRALLEDEAGNLWIGTRNNGLNYYDFANKTNKQYHPNNSGLQSDNIRSLAMDQNKRLWIGTDTGISIRFPDGSFDNLHGRRGDPNSFSNGNFFSIAVDKFNQVWAGSWNTGVSKIIYKAKGDYSVQHITASSSKQLLSDRVTFIYADKERPEVLVGTDHGLNHIFLNSDGSIASIKNYHTTGKNTLSSEFVWPVVRQGDSVIWVGTLGGGLNKIGLQKNGTYTIHAVSDNKTESLRDIESMLMDDKGNLWMAGKMLAMYNTSKNEFTYYDVNDGLQGNSFKIGAAYKGKSGRFYFGGTNGVSYFIPSEIVSNTNEPSVTLTDLLVNGEAVNIGDKDGEFEKAISYLNTLKLSSSQNNFSIQFSPMHYANPDRCKFRYKLEGYDKNWIYTDASNRFATYSNLDYDHYKIVVEASNNDGLWTGDAASLNIVVTPPWWKSTTAKVIYFILLLALIYAIWKYQHSWFSLKRKLQMRELEERKKEELHQMKLQFFTNISHEFRTPLTLILGPTEKMLHDDTDKKEQHNYLRLIYSNARRLLGLINELMDFRQAETDSLKLQATYGNLDKFVSSISTEFKELAQQRDITYTVFDSGHIIQQYFDPNIAEKILVNLIANAFKYTENGGEIEVEVLDNLQQFKPRFKNHVHIPSAAKVKDFTWIRVADTGIGITPNSINNIFDRYFRVNTLGREKHLGSGVGLALVKSLVELHKGELWVYSERNEGSEFIVGLPVKKEVFNHFEILDDTEHQIDFENLHYTIDWIDSDHEEADKSKKPAGTKADTGATRRKILVVEDNDEMRKFLVNSLSDEYEILEAANGVEGLSVAIENMPDLIVSDLMMPEMDGNELCRKVRADINISHTPVIIITAKASVETHIQGAESGADIYFPKPFSLRLLQVTIANLFEARARLKAKYNQDVFAETRELVNNQKDKAFLDEMIAIIEENMEDEELDVEMICKKIGISRTKLYGKIKGVTGQPIGEFIRLLRLKKAAKILVSEDVTIMEVMYRVGIQSQSYFTKAFKKEFGKTPSQFVAEFSKNKKTIELDQLDQLDQLSDD